VELVDSSTGAGRDLLLQLLEDQPRAFSGGAVDRRPRGVERDLGNPTYAEHPGEDGKLRVASISEAEQVGSRGGPGLIERRSDGEFIFDRSEGQTRTQLSK
jgi:hypothetical protein